MAIISLLESSALALFVVVGIFGLLVGSFLNVVIFRLPKILFHGWHSQCSEILELPSSDSYNAPLGLVTPRSRCRKCGTLISALDNIPVFSYLILRGRCRACGDPISVRYPAVETLTALLSVVVAWKFGFSPIMLCALLVTWALIALTFIDIDEMILPDNITLPLLWGGLLAAASGIAQITLFDAVIGAVTGYLALWSVYWLFKLVTGKEGMGYGDFKLLAALAAWLGWQQIPLIVILASVSGAVIGITMITIRKQDKRIPIPFGPYLAMGGWITMIWGDQILARYLQLANITG